MVLVDSCEDKFNSVLFYMYTSAGDRFAVFVEYNVFEISIISQCPTRD